MGQTIVIKRKTATKKKKPVSAPKKVQKVKGSK